MDLADYIYDVPDFPEKGVIFRDITPLLSNPEAFSYCIELMIESVK
jgi:adenine phosphoribosyltransferase